MALIYSFTTPDGVTHGRPDAETDTPPSDGVLVCPDGPFAGQRLEVRYAAIEGPPANHPYVLESGKRLYPTYWLHEALCAKGCSTTQ